MKRELGTLQNSLVNVKRSKQCGSTDDYLPRFVCILENLSHLSYFAKTKASNLHEQKIKGFFTELT